MNLTQLMFLTAKQLMKNLIIFFSIFQKIVDKHAPPKNASRKEKRLLTKSWLTRGLLKSIKHKNFLFANIHKTGNNSINYINDYKKYRNLLNRTLKAAKENHY